MSGKKPTYVTQPHLPPLAEFLPYLEQIWDSKILTNNGPFHQELEVALAEYLGVKYISLFSNGTIALVTALQALRISGEVITTPYTFPATTHSLIWNQIRPVFVDIDTDCNLDPSRVEEAITPHTTAIMPVHCYGQPCDVESIQEIADRYGLKVIYDAAHAFGVQHRDRSLLSFGDLSILSFHATKVFTTFEGGAIICPDEKSKRRIDYLKNFGFSDEVTVVASGINGKMNEVSAAMGLLQLKTIDAVLDRRRAIEARYRDGLADVAGLSFLPIPPETVGNGSYVPIFVEGGASRRDQLYEFLKGQEIHGRRYFYPLISNLPMYRGLGSAAPETLPIANQVSDSVICLPIFPDLSDAQQSEIIAAVKSFF